MAGETRRQRRDARRAAGAGAPQPGGAPGPDSAPVDGDEVPIDSASLEAESLAAAKPETELVAPGRKRRGGFIAECWAELKKVDWPGRPQVIQGTVVVIIACAIVGAYLWGVDQAVKPLVRDVFLG